MSIKQDKLLSIWLGVVCLSIIFMIFIGGLTRLKDSGLSITEWNVISGMLPPTSGESWEREFNKYKQYPEYQKHNMGMSIDEFKSIYMLEYFHRLAGRLTFLIYLIPMIVFLILKRISYREFASYFFALILLMLQGIMGWYMVQSGLSLNPYVSHFRLSAHLMLAVILYMVLFWQWMKNSVELILLPLDISLFLPKFFCIISIISLLIQIIFGAFTAGLNAGLIYNSFPLMGESFIPLEITKINFNDPVFVQFLHRNMGYFVFFIISVFCIFCYKNLSDKKFSYIIIYIFFILVLQMILGITTLLYQVPIFLALLHQIGAVLLLSVLLYSYFILKFSVELNR